METERTTKFRIKLDHQGKIFISDVKEVKEDKYLYMIMILSNSIIDTNPLNIHSGKECYIFGAEVLRNSIVTIIKIEE